MANNRWQKIYDAIRFYQPPSWIKAFMKDLNDALISLLIGVGQDFIQKAKLEIISLAKSDMSNAEKVTAFKKWAQDEMPGIKDQVINLIRETLYAKIKMEF